MKMIMLIAMEAIKCAIAVWVGLMLHKLSKILDKIAERE